MFTQKIGMDCTKEQYEKYLKDELLKMGYQDRSVYSWDCQKYQYISNNYMGGNGGLGTIHRGNLEVYNRTYLGSFNAPLFLALAAMTDKAEGNYGEYVIGLNTSAFYRMSGEDRILKEYKYIRKATKEEIMAKFGEKKSNHNTLENAKEVADKLWNDINKLKGAMIHEYIDQFFNRSSDEIEAINLLKSKGYKILKPTTWEEV